MALTGVACQVTPQHVHGQHALMRSSSTGSAINNMTFRQVCMRCMQPSRCFDHVDWTYIAISCCLQDRIASDGMFTASTDLRRTDADPQAAHMQAPPKEQTLARPPGLPETAPVAEPISDLDLRALVDWVSSCRRLVVLTGAGCSTESDIPDYRGPKGAYSSGFQPMTHQQVSSPEGCCCLEAQTHALRLHAAICSCDITRPCAVWGPPVGQLPSGLLLL